MGGMDTNMRHNIVGTADRGAERTCEGSGSEAWHGPGEVWG